MAGKRSIAILTGGGDCPGLNAVIRALTKKAILEHGMNVIGIEDGFEGVIQNRNRPLDFEDVSGILTQGGTILGTSNTANPYKYSGGKVRSAEFKDVSKAAIANINNLKIDCLICIGGDGTLAIAHKFSQEGVPILGLPKTIDNDLFGTDISFGFNSAVQIATEAIDRIHSTAQSHHRIMIVEVMGRNAGWLALHAGIAGGGDVLLIPEIPYDIERMVKKVKERQAQGKRFTIVVISEGARPKGGEVAVQRIVAGSYDPIRLGGIGFRLAGEIEEMTGSESRTVVLGHLQRGGTPTPFDRILATRLGAKAIDLVVEGKFGYMVGLQGEAIVDVPLADVDRGQKTIPLDEPLLAIARSIGTSFGD